MTLGKVTRTLTMKTRAAILAEKRLVVVRAQGTDVVALDLAGAREGDTVALLAADRGIPLTMDFPTDAAVVAVLENSC